MLKTPPELSRIFDAINAHQWQMATAYYAEMFPPKPTGASSHKRRRRVPRSATR